MLAPLKLDLSVLSLVAIPGLLLYFFQGFMQSFGLTPEGFKILTPVPDAIGFEPKTLPKKPVIYNRGAFELGFAFGYVVRDIPFSYTMQLSFRERSDAGIAVITVRHAGGVSKATAEFVRGWDQRREAFAIVLRERFDTDQAVPSLCIKTVMGRRADGQDLSNASVCVAERDIPGDCRLETLACGLLR